MNKTIDKKLGKKPRIKVSTQVYYHGMMLPGLIFMLIFCYTPMVGIVMAFQKYVPAKGIFGSKWVGLMHFKDLFANSDIFEIIRNTVVISLGKNILGTIAAITFAILLNEIRVKWLKKTVQTITYLPHFISWVILANIFSNLFGMYGMVNYLLSTLGFEKLNFLGSNSLFQPFLILTDVWKEFGYASIIYLAAITAVDPGLHEAACIDGATWFQRVWHVTLPGMIPIIVLMFAMNMANILSAGFDQVFNLLSVAVYDTGDILDTYVYRVGLLNLQYSFGTAVGLLKSIVGMILMLSVNTFSRKVVHRSVF